MVCKTYMRILEHFWVLVVSWWVHGNTIPSTHQVLLPVGTVKPRIFFDVSDHEDSTGKAGGFHHDAVWKTQ